MTKIEPVSENMILNAQRKKLITEKEALQMLKVYCDKADVGSLLLNTKAMASSHIRTHKHY